jgi:mono/diheme cytochrome c family protein
VKALLAVALVACDNGGATPDWSRMIDQPKLLPFAAMREPPAGTVSREHVAAGELPPITRALLDRGANRFAIVCATCHGVTGDGDSLVARNMQRRKPPSLHEARIAALPPARVYDIITEGYGLMPSFAGLLAPADRWAVIAYARTLDLAWRMR